MKNRLVLAVEKIVKNFVVLTNNSLDYHYRLDIVIIVLSYFQILSYYLFSTDGDRNNFDYSYRDLGKVMGIIGMPTILLYELSMKVKCLFLIVPGCIIFIYLILTLICLKDSGYIMNKLEQKEEYRLFVTIFSYYSVTYNYYLFNILLSLALMPISQIVYDGTANSNLYIIIISIILTLIILFKAFFFSYFAELSYSAVEKSLSRNIVTNSYAFQTLLKCIMNIINIFQANGNFFKGLQAALVFLYLLIALFELFYLRPYTKQILVKGILYSIVLTFTITFFNLISNDYFEVCTLISFPLLSILLNSAWNFGVYNKEILGNVNLNNHMMRDLHYRIGLLIYQQEELLYDKNESFILFSLLQQHKMKCIDKFCFCKRRVILKSIQGTRMTINQDFMKRYILMLVHRMGDYFKLCKFNSRDIIYFVHYIYLLNEFDQSTLALAQLNQMMFQNRNSNKFGLYQMTILSILNQHIKQRMTQNNMINKNEKVSIFTQVVESFLCSEQNSKEVKKDIADVLDLKIKFFDSILMGKFEKAQEMYQQSDLITQIMTKTEKNLEDLYFAYPSNKQKSLMSFYQAEILNNFYKAFSYQHLVVDNKVSQLYQKSPINFFSSEMIYLIVAYGKEKGRIKNYSQKAASFFGYEKERFDFVRSIEDLIPPGISAVHDAFVNNFFQTGSSGFFRNLGTSLAKLESGFLLPIEILFDINFLVQDEFTFVVFLRQLMSKNVFLIIDEHGRIGGITENFFKQIGAPPDLHRDVLIKLSQSLNINNLIPTFWDLMNQMQEQEVTEAKHFDVSLKFIKDLDKFVTRNTDLLKKNQAQELNLKASVNNKKKKIKKSPKDGQVNSPNQQSQLAMAYIKKSSFFNNESSNNNITQNSLSYFTPNSTPLNPLSDISDRSLHSHHTLNSRKTLRSAKSFVSRKTLGWKKSKMAKFQTNLIIRTRNFVTDDASVAFKYYIVELEDLKKPQANDWLGSNSDSYASNTTPQRSFMTMKTGKSINTLASGSFQMSNHSLEEEKERNLNIDGEDDNLDYNGEQTQYKLSKYNTILQPIEEEQNDLNQKRSSSQNQFQTNQASIFSGKKQLGWVTRIVNMRKQKIQEQQERDQNQFITQVNTEQSEDKNIQRIKTEKKLQNRQQTPLEKNSNNESQEDLESDNQGQEDDEDNEDGYTASNNQTSMSRTSGAKSERSSKSSKKSVKSSKKANSRQSLQSSNQQGLKKGTTAQNEDTASFTKGQTLMSHDNNLGVIHNLDQLNENKSFLGFIHNQTNKLKEEEEQQLSSQKRIESERDINKLNLNQRIDSKNKISFINVDLFVHSDSKKEPGSNINSVVQEEKQVNKLNGIDLNHKNYFDDNILDESNRQAMKDQVSGHIENSNLLFTLDRSNISYNKNHEEQNGEKKLSLIKQGQNSIKHLNNSLNIDTLSQKQISTSVSNNQIPLSIISGQELDNIPSTNYRGIPLLSKNFSPIISNNQKDTIREDYLLKLGNKQSDIEEDINSYKDYQQKFYNNEFGGGESDIASQTIKMVGSQIEVNAKEEQIAKESHIYKIDENFVQTIFKCFSQNSSTENDDKKQNGQNLDANLKLQQDNVRTSKQYFVYEQLNSFQKSSKIPQSIQFGLFFWILGLLIFLAFCLTLLFSIRSKFNNFDNTLNLLNVQNEIILPVNNLQTLSLLNKQSMLNGYNPSDQNVSLIQSILLEGVSYYLSYFQTSLQFRLGDETTMNKWIDQTLQVLMKNSLNYSDQTLPLLQIIQLLQNNMSQLAQEFQLKSVPQESDIRYDSFFQQINYHPIIDYFDGFSEQAASQNNQITTDTQTLLTEISLPMIFSSIFIFIISFYYLLKYKELQENMMKFFYHTDKISLSRDIQRYKILKSIINQGEDQIYQYKFSINNHDAFLEAEDEFHEKLVTEMKNYKARLPDINLQQSRIFILFFFVFISYIIFIAGSFTYLKIFISNYQDFINNLQDFSRISYKTSNLMSERELCYASFSTSLQQEFPQVLMLEYQDVSSMFKSDIDQLGNFINNIGQLQFQIVDVSIVSQVQNLFKQDICLSMQYNSTFYKRDRNVYDQACHYIQQGTLNQGLITSLNNIRNKFNSEFKENHFQQRTLYNNPNQILDDSLAITLISQQISMLSNKIINNANQKKDSVNNILTIIICISMVVLGLINFLLFMRGKNHLLQVYNNNKLIIFLLPQQTLFMQHKLFNQFKTFLKRYNL
ncbi:transmembrane protein, putative (macronuclear) [Tetrahymena thermophila SB210]|uniref:Transmembrane protein, putative n=1 Tax=Tetrahymena thermophila (strain SB210) TaxID=312017 RepID=I7MI53_TETTS|nr:transmembrane protein, putative [Tetrahymena thermophila SB210]EAS03901.2 transmembrane protein, putative [Tetrahymena thermophila SB210]|eukprot:XP_001024146.2 transmembrane protein, putative [Tetrahymena thermophila SB210]